MKKKVKMPIREYLDEHKSLINILESGSEEERKKEAKKQKQEVKRNVK